MEFWEKPPIDELYHYGTPRHSGRYPWGSGENPYQHEMDFKARVQQLKKDGVSETDIAASFGMSTTQLRKELTNATDRIKKWEYEKIVAMKSDGYSNAEIAKALGLPNESSVRSKLDQATVERRQRAAATADYLKEQVDKKGMIDVTAGVERELGISPGKMQQAIRILKDEGYELYQGKMEQMTNPGQWTTMAVLGKPGTEYKDIYKWDEVQSVTDYISDDKGETFRPKFVYPASMDSSRLKIRYADEVGADGAKGIERDGLIEIRPGVADLSLGNSQYAQVRILVDDTHYLKGMAIYSNNIPDGYDVVFNTNKPESKGLTGTLKEIKKDDPTNPFNSLLKENGGQSYYTDANGEKKLSLINKTREEGDWGEWADKLPSQFLSKQSLQLIRSQLGESVKNTEAEFKEIMELDNPTVQKKMLIDFADSCDKAAKNLSAMALPRQKYQVLIPIPDLKDNEIYAPNYEDGETVALIRYPHGGTFEIPILTVNNKNPQGKEYIGNGMNGKLDAVGINSAVAGRLSGADFDGDTAMVIPCNSDRSKIKITSTHPLKGLVGFDPETNYGEHPGMRYMKKSEIQKQMGMISNLITDMTLQGATESELERAVKHSMVVIDAYKHKYDYEKSEADNGIAALKEKYQGKHLDLNGNEAGGAATIISRAKSPFRVPKRQGSYSIDPVTGNKIWKEADDAHYTDAKGREKVKSVEVASMDAVPDARMLIRGYPKTGHPKEEAYADYANTMKRLANEARLASINVVERNQDKTAAIAYSEEVASLKAKLNNALLNAPKERAAQRLAFSEVKTMTEANPGLKDDKKELKKIKTRALNSAREAVGASRQAIDITDKEWAAIQSNAISKTTLNSILRYADSDKVRKLAMPKSQYTVSDAKLSRMRQLFRKDYTIAQIADQLGLSTTTVQKYLSESSVMQ